MSQRISYLMLLSAISVSLMMGCFEKASGPDDGGTPAGPKYRITKSTTYNGSSVITSIVSYTYDAGNHVLIMRTGDCSNNLRAYVEYEYDNAGNKTKESNFAYRVATQDTPRTAYQVWTYDANNKMTKHEKFLGSGTANGYETWEYDASGHQIRWNNYALTALSNYTTSQWSGDNLIRLTSYSGASVVQSIDTFSYDAQGHQLTSVKLHADGTTWSYSVFTYDGSGNMLTERRYEANGSLRGGTNNIWSGTLLTKSEQLDTAGAVSSTVTSTYNASGKKTEELATNASGGQTGRKTYTYDANGNLTEYTERNALDAVTMRRVDEWEQY